MAYEDEALKRFRRQNAGNVATGAGAGALSGLGTGAQLGSLIPLPIPGLGTAIGAGVGALGGAIAGGIGSSRKMSPLEKANQAKIAELERRMELGQLGLTPEERSAIFGAAEDRERRAREAARQDRGRMTESFTTGAGVAAAQAAQAEEFAVDQMRKTGQKVAELDLKRAQEQEQEYFDRLAATSLQEANAREQATAKANRAYQDFNELLTSEMTTSGPGETGDGGGDEDRADRVAERFGSSKEAILSAAKALSGNQGLFDLLMQSGG